jgi:hypothetical protein
LRHGPPPVHPLAVQEPQWIGMPEESKAIWQQVVVGQPAQLHPDIPTSPPQSTWSTWWQVCPVGQGVEPPQLNFHTPPTFLAPKESQVLFGIVALAAPMGTLNDNAMGTTNKRMDDRNLLNLFI